MGSFRPECRLLSLTLTKKSRDQRFFYAKISLKPRCGGVFSFYPSIIGFKHGFSMDYSIPPDLVKWAKWFSAVVAAIFAASMAWDTWGYYTRPQIDSYRAAHESRPHATAASKEQVGLLEKRFICFGANSEIDRLKLKFADNTMSAATQELYDEQIARNQRRFDRWNCAEVLDQ